MPQAGDAQSPGGRSGARHLRCGCSPPRWPGWTEPRALSTTVARHVLLNHQRRSASGGTLPGRPNWPWCWGLHPPPKSGPWLNPDGHRCLTLDGLSAKGATGLSAQPARRSDLRRGSPRDRRLHRSRCGSTWPKPSRAAMPRSWRPSRVAWVTIGRNTNRRPLPCRMRPTRFEPDAPLQPYRPHRRPSHRLGGPTTLRRSQRAADHAAFDAWRRADHGTKPPPRYNGRCARPPGLNCRGAVAPRQAMRRNLLAQSRAARRPAQYAGACARGRGGNLLWSHRRCPWWPVTTGTGRRRVFALADGGRLAQRPQRGGPVSRRRRPPRLHLRAETDRRSGQRVPRGRRGRQLHRAHRAKATSRPWARASWCGRLTAAAWWPCCTRRCASRPAVGAGPGLAPATKPRRAWRRERWPPNPSAHGKTASSGARYAEWWLLRLWAGNAAPLDGRHRCVRCMAAVVTGWAGSLPVRGWCASPETETAAGRTLAGGWRFICGGMKHRFESGKG